MQSPLKGTLATVLLPIEADESIDFARLRDDLDYLAESGVDGIYTNGTAAEFFAQSEEEFDCISRMVAETCGRLGLPFQIGASHPCAQTSLERLHRAAQLHPAAIQVILPDWVPPHLEEARAFLERMAEAAHPVPLVLYNPPGAKRVLRPEQYAAVAKFLAGIKVGLGDESWFAGMQQHAKEIAIFVPGHRLATGHSRGAAGSYSNVACLQPRGAAAWYRLMQTDLPTALQIEARIVRFIETYVLPYRAEGYSDPALDKLLATAGRWGCCGTRLRWPYRGLDAAAAAHVGSAAREQIPELFE
jgi:dihydrodipicolinate synthase/N-acetylneuraminate lyase